MSMLNSKILDSGSEESSDINDVDVWDKSVKAEENMYYWKGAPRIIYPPTSEVIMDGDLTIGELFCGCGGTSLGFELAGFKVKFGLDIHIPSIDTFTTNHPCAVGLLGDIRKVKLAHWGSIVGKDSSPDVLIGGVPCQGFSLNNRKRHENDERNFLYKEFIRIAKQLRPKVVVIENVSGMISTGDVVESIKKNLTDELNMKVTYCLLNASDYGVPQKRQRLIFVGIKGKEYFDFNKIEKTHGPGRKYPFNTIKDAIGDLPSLSSGEEASVYKSKPISDYQKLMRKGYKGKLLNHRAPNHPEDTIEKIRNTKPGEPMYPRFKQRIRLAWEILSPTQVSGGIRPQFQFGHPSDDRGLTIRERCRIQSFPDNFFVTGGIVQGRVQTGNAVPPLLAKAIAEEIKRQVFSDKDK